MGLETILIVGAAAAVVGIAAGTTGSIISSVEQHKAQKKQADIAEENARVQQRQAAYNQRVEEREAAIAAEEARENSRRQREEYQRLMSSQAALYGKSGAALSAGSPLAILGQTAADEATASDGILRTGYREQQKHLLAARGFSTDSTIAGLNAASARASKPGYTQLTGAILGHVGDGIYKTGNVIMSAASASKK